MIALNPFIRCLRRSTWTSAFLDAVNASALALMAVVTLQLAISTLARSTVPYVDVLAVTISIVSAILAIRLHINAAWLVLGGAVIGWIAFSLGYIR